MPIWLRAIFSTITLFLMLAAGLGAAASWFVLWFSISNGDDWGFFAAIGGLLIIAIYIATYHDLKNRKW